ncbi:nucleotidyltransferase family protein [soil metagenome]
MSPRPTVIVLATNLDSRMGDGDDEAHHGLDVNTAFALTLHHALSSLLPMVVVVSPDFASLACSSVAARDVVVVEPAAASRARGPRSGLGGSIAAGVWARPESPGWLVVPADLPMLRPSTMRAVAAALADNTVAYAQHLGRAGHPIGFAGELYSELVSSDDSDMARRLMARYPAHAVEVDDAGAVSDFSNQEEVASLRTASAEHRALRYR